MKTKLILGSFMAFASYSQAQWSTNGSNVYYNGGNVGIGTSTPIDKLQVVDANNGGISIKQTSYGAAGLTLENTTTGGKKYIVGSLGSGNTQGAGHFSIYDYSNAKDRFLIEANTGNVGIGTITPATNTKLHVIGTTVGIRGEGTSGVRGFGVASSGQTYGVRGEGTNGMEAIGAGNPFISNATGIYAYGYGAPINYGTYTEVNAASSTGYGIYSKVNSAGAGDYAGWFDGDVNINGLAYCTNSVWSSDRKLKKDIRPISESLDKIALLKPSTYYFRTDEFASMRLPSEKQIGLIAQDLETVFPELVVEKPEANLADREGKVTTFPAHKSVNYIGLIPVLISGIQEQQAQIAELKQELADLKGKQSSTTGLNTINGEAGFKMDQNEPNPFNGQTTIKYSLPASVSSANLLIYDLTGKQINSFPVNQRQSSITLTSENLAAGIYIYSIVADGKLMDSKRMVVSEK